MRHLTAVLAATATGILVAACGTCVGAHQSHENGSATTAARAPVTEAALDALLLSSAEIDAAMGVTGMAPKEKFDKLSDNRTKKWPQDWKWPTECLYAYGPAEAGVYAGSGHVSVRVRDETAPTSTPGIGEIDPEVAQAVVLFPSAAEANAFFTASAKSWPACSDHQFTTPGNADNPEKNWKVGALSTRNALLSIPVSVFMAQGVNSIGGTCQRALTVRNNVAIDVSACAGKDPGDLGVKLADQIAAKIDKK